MKYRVLTIIALIFFGGVLQAQNKRQNTVLIRIAEENGPIIGPKHLDVLISKNSSGFETGQVVKLGDTYHMFVNEMFQRSHRDMRIAYWVSKDAISWKRKSTLLESIPGRSPSNPRSEVWVTGVEFNEEENAWNIFYVAYRGGDELQGEIKGYDYSGKIWRAKSVIPGKMGVAGPYADMGIILQPDVQSQSWEGQQALASFNPYKVNNKWYAAYDGHTHIPRGGWPTGLATADHLGGAWTRMPESINPLNIVEEFMENAVVTKLKSGGYVMVFDSLGNQEIGYSFSEDGIHWTKEKRIAVQSENNKWAKDGDHAMRTPLCVIEEEKGLFTVVYTAMMNNEDKRFYAIGKCTLRIEE